MNSVIEKLISELDKVVNGDPWYGASLRVVVESITYKQAVAKHNSNIHSVAEIVHHICAWLEEVSSRLEGYEPKEPARNDWIATEQISEEEWNKLVGDLFKAHNQLLIAIRNFPQEKFECIVGQEQSKELGTGFTFREMLVGLMEHNVYHCGQIALLKKLT